MYISAASTISHQPTFKNDGFSDKIVPLTGDSALIVPNYKEYIDAGLLRRMSKILRMSVSAAADCLQQSGVEQPGAIIVGTGLGCLQDTEKFLNNFQTIEGLLPPTSFIQSTHNTIAGQISLSIGNHGYNMTHTQNSLSFEHALIDAQLSIAEGADNILAGAADEFIDILTEIGAQLGLETTVPLTSGASFFTLSKQASDSALACIKDVEAIGMVNDIEAALGNSLHKDSTMLPDLVLYANPIGQQTDDFSIPAYFSGFDKAINCVNYAALSGLYPSNAAFAMHYAVDKIKNDASVKRVLVVNTLNKINLGLTLIESIEA